MHVHLKLLKLLKLLLPLAAVATLGRADGNFLNQWAVKIRGGPENADLIAEEMDYVNHGELKSFPDTYVMEKKDHPRRSRRHANHLTKRLTDDVRVIWAEQQFSKIRDKRRVQPPDTDEEKIFSDPLFSHEWYLIDTRANGFDHLPKLDLNVMPCWQKGFTGKGVVVTVLDDGLEWNHTDIKRNYDPYASTDVNDGDNDPFPRYDEYDSNRHGTRCAGEVAMLADNNKCGVGVAYEAKIGGVRMLDGPVSDVTEGKALAFNLTHIWIFTASWGPSDDGRTVEGPGRLASEAFKMGIETGRGGKGVIYVWASGNGGQKGDNCNCDGYTGSVYTLSIGSASQQGQFPWYGEKCASTMACTYSSGAYTDQKISSTDLHDQCTIDHTGTSAAAPLAAGIIALVLEANPELTWRDVQHLTVWTSDYRPLRKNDGWVTNDAGLKFNSRFGFGLMNADAMVTAALNWTNVPSKNVSTVKATNVELFPIKIGTGHDVSVTFNVDGDGVQFLEHVEVIADIAYKRRGALQVLLHSPRGTQTELLFPRKIDFSNSGFRNWKFMSVHTWGEDPRGIWTLTVQDKTREMNTGLVKSATLIVHGTSELPAHMAAGKRKYDVEDESESESDQRQEEPSQKDKGPVSILKEKFGNNLSWNDLVGLKLARRNSLLANDEYHW